VEPELRVVVAWKQRELVTVLAVQWPPRSVATQATHARSPVRRPGGSTSAASCRGPPGSQTGEAPQRSSSSPESLTTDVTPIVLQEAVPQRGWASDAPSSSSAARIASSVVGSPIATRAVRAPNPRARLAPLWSRPGSVRPWVDGTRAAPLDQFDPKSIQSAHVAASHDASSRFACSSSTASNSSTCSRWLR
jgi:hypothetical protein